MIVKLTPMGEPVFILVEMDVPLVLVMEEVHLVVAVRQVIQVVECL